MKVYRAKVKKDWKGKTIWSDVGYTVFLKDDGKMSLLDERTNTNYYLFDTANRPKKEKTEPVKVETPADPIKEDIPF